MDRACMGVSKIKLTYYRSLLEAVAQRVTEGTRTPNPQDHNLAL